MGDNLRRFEVSVKAVNEVFTACTLSGWWSEGEADLRGLSHMYQLAS